MFNVSTLRGWWNSEAMSRKVATVTGKSVLLVAIAAAAYTAALLATIGISRAILPRAATTADVQRAVSTLAADNMRLREELAAAVAQLPVACPAPTVTKSKRK